MAIGPPEAGDRLAVCVATLGLLRIAGRDAPVLAVVDDAQWLDAPSLGCVRYAARRAGGRVAFAIAERVQDGVAAGAQPGTDGIDVLDVPSLTLEEAVAVLARLFPGLSPSVAGALARASDGIPLALVEELPRDSL